MSPTADVNAFLDSYAVGPWSRGEVGALDDLVTADFLLDGEMTIDEFKTLILTYRAAFPDLRNTIDDVVSSGDKIAFRWTMSGTHQGEFEGHPPTEQLVTVTGITMLRLEDGKVAEDRFESSGPSISEQVSGP